MDILTNMPIIREKAGCAGCGLQTPPGERGQWRRRGTYFSPCGGSSYAAWIHTGSVTAITPILWESGAFDEGVEGLRGVKDKSDLTAAEKHQRFSKSAIVSAKNLLPENGVDRHTFGDLKLIHAAISHEVFQGHGLDFEGWVRVACGQCAGTSKEEYCVSGGGDRRTPPQAVGLVEYRVFRQVFDAHADHIVGCLVNHKFVDE